MNLLPKAKTNVGHKKKIIKLLLWLLFIGYIIATLVSKLQKTKAYL